MDIYSEQTRQKSEQKGKTMNKKGNLLFVLIWALIVIFVTGFVWMVMDKPMQELDDRVRPHITSENLPTLNKIHSSWLKWPVTTILAVLLYVIIYVVLRGGGKPNSPY